MDGGNPFIGLEAAASVSVSPIYLLLLRGSLKKSRGILRKNECANTSVAKYITDYMLKGDHYVHLV